MDSIAGLVKTHDSPPLVGEYFNVAAGGDLRVVFVIAEEIDDRCEQVLRSLGSRADEIAVIALCSSADSNGETVALEAGADAYVPIELDVRRLHARLRAVVAQIEHLRRPERPMPPIRLDPAIHEVRVNGYSAQLSPNEFRLLEELQRRRRRVVTHSDLEMLLWGEASRYTRHSLTQLVYRLRARLGEAGDVIISIPRIGYILH